MNNDINTPFFKVIKNIVLKDIIFSNVSNIHKHLQLSAMKGCMIASLEDSIRCGRFDLFTKNFDNVIKTYIRVLPSDVLKISTIETLLNPIYEELLNIAFSTNNHLAFNYILQSYQQQSYVNNNNSNNNHNNNNNNNNSKINNNQGKREKQLKPLTISTLSERTLYSLDCIKVLTDSMSKGLVSIDSYLIRLMKRVAILNCDLTTLDNIKKLFPDHQSNLPGLLSQSFSEKFIQSSTTSKYDYNSLIKQMVELFGEKILIDIFLRSFKPNSQNSSTPITSSSSLSITSPPLVKILLKEYKSLVFLPGLLNYINDIEIINWIDNPSTNNSKIILYEYIYLLGSRYLFKNIKDDINLLLEDQNDKISFLDYLVKRQEECSDPSYLDILYHIFDLSLLIGHLPTIKWSLEKMKELTEAEINIELGYAREIHPSVSTLELLKSIYTVIPRFNVDLATITGEALEYILNDEFIEIQDYSFENAIYMAIKRNDIKSLSLLMNCDKLISPCNIHIYPTLENANLETLKYLFSAMKEYSDYFNLIPPHNMEEIVHYRVVVGIHKFDLIRSDLEYSHMAYYLACICLSGKLTVLKEFIQKRGPFSKPSWDRSNESLLQFLISSIKDSSSSENLIEMVSFLLDYFSSQQNDKYLDNLDDMEIDGMEDYYLGTIILALSKDQYELSHKLLRFYSLDDETANQSGRFINFDNIFTLLSQAWILSDNQYSYFWNIYFGKDIFDRRIVDTNPNYHYYYKLHLKISKSIERLLILWSKRYNANYQYLSYDLSQINQIKHHINRIINSYSIFMDQQQQQDIKQQKGNRLGLQPLNPPFIDQHFEEMHTLPPIMVHYLIDRFYHQKNNDTRYRYNRYTKEQYHSFLYHSITIISLFPK